MLHPLSCVLLRTCISIFLLLVSVSLGWTDSPKAPAEQPQTVVAIGDVHGDFDAFVAILKQTGLIDNENHWAGGKTTLVQVGDLIDRGPKPREVMDLMMSLEKEAAKSGGRVTSLLGNHETMNLMGDLRYVTPANYASFADPNSKKRQKSAYNEYVKWRGSHPQLIAELPQPAGLTEAEWMARHPEGFIEQREAFGPKGEYGKWLRGHSAIVKIGGVIFLHGGLHPDLVKLELSAINDRIHDEIKAFDAAKQYLQDEKVLLPFFDLPEIGAVVQAGLAAEHRSAVPTSEQHQAALKQFLGYEGWLSVVSDGPLWFRGYDQWTEEEGATQINKILEAFTAKRIVVGHTVQKGGRIRPRFDSKVFLIDTGMLSSSYPGGRPSALRILGDAKITADYLDQQVVLLSAVGFRYEKEDPRTFRRLRIRPEFRKTRDLRIALANRSVHDNALEFLDNVLKPQLREILVPLLDGKITVSERARLAQRLVHAKIENQEQAVAALVASDDPWLRSCGAHAIGTLRVKSLEAELNRCLNDSDPLLRETARVAKLRPSFGGSGYQALTPERENKKLPNSGQPE